VREEEKGPRGELQHRSAVPPDAAGVRQREHCLKRPGDAAGDGRMAAAC